MAVDNSFRLGVMSLVILALLKREDMYGYQLVQETEKESGGRLTTQELIFWMMIKSFKMLRCEQNNILNFQTQY